MFLLFELQNEDKDQYQGGYGGGCNDNHREQYDDTEKESITSNPNL
jgi:hypothetical protein